jgi:hypothetical protein
MPAFSRHLAAACLAAGATTASCAGPTQPTVNYGQGVTLYPDSVYRGDRVTLNGDVGDLSKLKGPCQKSEDEAGNYDDCVSSLHVPDGWTVTIFRDRGFAGGAATFTADVADLNGVIGPCKGGFNDCVSSLKVALEPHALGLHLHPHQIHVGRDVERVSVVSECAVGGGLAGLDRPEVLALR